MQRLSHKRNKEICDDEHSDRAIIEAAMTSSVARGKSISNIKENKKYPMSFQLLLFFHGELAKYVW